MPPPPEPSRCPVCGAEHPQLARRCAACGAFLHGRVATLHLFPTLYLLLERPGEAFRRIARSEQNNYVLTLACCAGPILLAVALSIARAGDGAAGFLALFGLLAAAGPAAGLLLTGLLALVLRWPGAAIMRGRTPFRLTAAFAAWSVSPLAYASLLLLPLLLGMFGSFLFSGNPSPAELKPLAFRVFAALLAGCALWSFSLTVRSFTVTGIPWSRSAAAAALAWGAVAACVGAGGIALRAALQA